MARRPEECDDLEVARDWHGPSPKRFQGWEPTWVTEYEYDDVGRLVRSVTRMAEPEWDDATRALAQGLARKERETCPGCGLHSSVLADPHRHRFTFDERVCAVCAAQDVFDRSVKKREERTLKSLEDAPPTVPRPGDGRYFYLRPLTDEEREKEESRGRPPGKRRS